MNTNINNQNLEGVYAQLELDGKKKTIYPISALVTSGLVGVPALLAVLPLSIMYQSFKMLQNKVMPSSKDSSKVGVVEDNDSTEEYFFPKTLSELTPLKERRYDVVLLGATGFTGSLAAEYLASNYRNNKEGVTWALAGRSDAKLMALKQKLAEKFQDETMLDIETVIVDTNKRETLPSLVKDTRAVITTAGPFELYSSPVVEFCARYGTHYCDITGEVEWSKDMIMKWDAKAQETGAKIVSFCGHDSVPWDLTVHKLTETIRKEYDDDLVDVTIFDEVKGGISGGTIKTALLSIEGESNTPRYSFNPFMKKADGTQSSSKTKVNLPLFVSPSDTYKGKWTAPFIMAGVNGEIVKRSNALRENTTSKVNYKEVLLADNFATAFVSWFGLTFGVVSLLNPMTGYLMKKVLPNPGEGPDVKLLQKGFLRITGLAKGSKGGMAESVMYFPKDAGYSETARMLVESGLCLALDGENLENKAGGCFTPSTGMGDALLQRLISTGTKFACRPIKSRL